MAICFVLLLLDFLPFFSIKIALYQDNKSAIFLEKNSKKSISKRRKHIAIKYYFITDRVKADELNIEYCPTGDMVADYFTKPLQGKKFYQFRK